MIIIFCQGNPGTEYEKTRHNIGWQILNTFAVENVVEFIDKPKFFAYLAEINSNENKILLVKPTTFYNETGRCLKYIKDFYKIKNNEILVLHDDLSLDFGKIRIRHRGSDAGNNGIKSLNSRIGEDFIRVKIGILNDKRKLMNDSNFVLARFSAEEQEIINKNIYPKIDDLLKEFIKNGDLEDESFSI